ncbi:MAG: twin-arginine translocation signal domain-containing protein, partial [Acidobacteria bacterium]|nr:twin-arginine translocation signal domain-containing protein [Acidobacteriota bacterium]
MKKKGVSRRDFLKKTGMGTAAVGTAALAGVAPVAPTEAAAALAVDRHAVFAALGDTII